MSDTADGIRIIEMPDLGTVDDTSSVVGERLGSGRFTAPALRSYVLTNQTQVWDVPLPDSYQNITHTKGVINQGMAGHQYWQNFDELNYNGNGGASSDIGNGVTRYMAANRNAPAPGSYLWSAIVNVSDNTGLKTSLTGGFQLLEMDATASGPDDIIGGRTVLNIVANKWSGYAGTDTTLSAGIAFFSDSSNCNFIDGIRLATGWTNAAINLTLANSPSNVALALKQGMSIQWDTLGHSMYYDTTALGGAGGLAIWSKVQINDNVYIPDALTVGGLVSMTGILNLPPEINNSATFSGTITFSGIVNFGGPVTFTTLPPNAANDAAAAGAGVAVGGLYRNGSVLQIRIA